MPIFDSVSRETYDLLKTMYDQLRADHLALLDKYHALRATHSPVAPIRARML